jgi:hypothetical protein
MYSLRQLLGVTFIGLVLLGAFARPIRMVADGMVAQAQSDVSYADGVSSMFAHCLSGPWYSIFWLSGNEADWPWTMNMTEHMNKFGEGWQVAGVLTTILGIALFAMANILLLCALLTVVEVVIGPPPGCPTPPQPTPYDYTADEDECDELCMDDCEDDSAVIEVLPACSVKQTTQTHCVVPDDKPIPSS